MQVSEVKKLKVGDKVKIRKGSKSYDWYVPAMEKAVGMIGTISYEYCSTDNDIFVAGPKHLFNEEQYLEIWNMIFSQTGYPPHHPKHPDYMKDRNRGM